jgi:cholesterol transport system auxiliary component
MNALARRPPFLAVALLLAIFTGCSLWPEAPEPPSRHDFGPFAPARQSFPWSAVLVTSPEWLEDSGIDYRFLYANPTERHIYTRDQWVAAPALLLQQRLNRGQRPGSPRLRIDLEEFEQVFDRPGQSRVVIALKATIETGASGDLGAARDFRFQSPTPTADAAGALHVFPILIRQAEAALRDWVREQP